MTDLPDPCNLLLRAIVDSPIAWQSPAQLAVRLGLDLDLTYDALAELDLAGWVDPWELGSATFVTLTPRAADCLRVRLERVGRSDAMRWASADVEPTPQAPARGQAGASSLDFLIDDGPGPDELAEASERADRLVAAQVGPARAGLLPRPTILVGAGLTPWPGPRRDPKQVCPACRSRELAGSAYCLVCDRWGLDHLLLGAPRRGSRPGRPTPNTPPAPDPREQAARDKADRKARRRRKWAIQEERERARRVAARRRDPGLAPDGASTMLLPTG